MSDPPDDPPANGVPQQTRRLSDKILIAFHQACDQRDLEVAEVLLRMLEVVTSPGRGQAGTPDGRGAESLVAASERLDRLRHPGPTGRMRRSED
jgi:hypothetical protein